MIEANQLSKRYGSKFAVDNISFSLQPGLVTGFLGPNGAGKSTTMRMLMGLDRPTSGSITVLGKPFAAHRSPIRVVGALLDAKGVHPGRTARSHLQAIAATHGISNTRVNQVLEQTGLESVGNKRVGEFSLGMGQRLGIAAALLGDPQVLVLDEPVNGLDPDGVRWVRQFVRSFAADGRTVLLSSHLMSEMAQTADHLLVIGRGKLIADAAVNEIIAAGTQQVVRVSSPEVIRLGELLRSEGARSTQEANGYELQLQGLPIERVGEIAAQYSIVLHSLVADQPSLEDAYMQLTRESLEYQAPITESESPATLRNKSKPQNSTSHNSLPTSSALAGR